MRKTQTEKERFLGKLPAKPTDDSCWEWQGGRFKLHGKYAYGCFVNGEGKAEGAHRVGYRLFKGPIPEGKCILHSCDNPVCCNPDHLTAGTKTENAKDRDSKGRGCYPGDPRHPQTKVTPEMRRAIRRDALRIVAETGTKYGLFANLAKIYPVKRITIARVCEYSLPSNLPNRRPVGEYKPS